MHVQLDGKAVIVTGASSGIGAEIARAIAGAGADLALVGRDAGRLAGVADAVEEAGSRPLLIEADVTEDGAGQRIVDETVARFGRLDALVNAAGVFELAPFEDSLGN